MKPHSRRDRVSSAPGGKVALRAGREKSLEKRHPWVFSGGIATIGDAIVDGDIADVVTDSGAFVARGMVNRRSQIVVRVLTFDEGEPVDAAFWESRLRRSIATRQTHGAARLVNAESDGLPGLVLDRYGADYVLQASALGVERNKAQIVSALQRIVSPSSVYERSDVGGRDKEGLAPTTGLLAGREPPEFVEIEERTHDGHSLTLLVDVRRGHKTGTYLDQTENRRIVGSCSADADVLNLFSYTGGFALHAALGGARRAVNVDSSAEALALSERIAALNGVSARVEHVRGDAFDVLRKFRTEGTTFDVVVLDPPKFAHSANQVDRAARAYKDLARVAFHIIRPGGYLATFSCSGAISADLFQKIAFSASLEARRDAQIVRRLTQAPDHPVLLSFPEGDYLKGLLCRVR